MRTDTRKAAGCLPQDVTKYPMWGMTVPHLPRYSEHCNASSLRDQKGSRMYCEIYVKGYIPADWSDWFGGLQITNLSNGDAMLAGELADQAALFGVLNHIHGMRLALLTLATSKGQRALSLGGDTRR